ncbi:AAA family ATPase [Mailhella massiliensis]|uniref:AAA family ATPase n=1 Tax=Mailhella massiliensis TaxID=1903261 RepID=UPI0023F552C6|nr:AAA family ATPase [Mailhella massiliensis]
MPRLNSITIKGFKSIRSLENFELKNLNILIGGNGAGKSNFIEFFHLVLYFCRASLPGNSNELFFKEVLLNGGAENFLHNGSKVTEKIESSFTFDDKKYQYNFIPTVQNTFWATAQWPHDSVGIAPLVEGCREYHFHDTSRLSPMRKSADLADVAYLRPDGKNLAPFLCKLKDSHPKHYQKIIRYIRLIAPFFYDFKFEPPVPGQVWLDWQQKNSDYPMKPYQFSDGTLRFIALATALLQPNPPAIMLIDEPELGLHPDAIGLVAELMKMASRKSQLVVATQSPALLDAFSPEDVVVVKREDGATVFKRLNKKEYNVWLDEFSLGDLWRRNIISGGAEHE